MATEIESLTITRLAPSYWVYVANGDIEGDANAYTGTRNGDFLTIKTRTGAILLEDIYFGYIDYIDQSEPLNNLINPSSAQEMQGHLVAQGFYEGSAGEGTGSVTTFKQLLDVAVPSFFGREGQFLVIDENGEFVNTTQNPAQSLKLQDLDNYLSTGFAPRMIVMTSSLQNDDGTAAGFVLSSPYNLINRPPKYDEVAVMKKGYVVIDNSVIFNQEEYALEIGDICLIWSDTTGETVPELIMGKWNGGSVNDVSSFDRSLTQKFDDDLT